jgi:hypothetical protein
VQLGLGFTSYLQGWLGSLRSEKEGECMLIRVWGPGLCLFIHTLNGRG